MDDNKVEIKQEENIINDLRRNDSTHNPLVETCTGHVLANLAMTYGKYKKLNDELLSEDKVNFYLHQLEEELKKQNDPELNNAWKYIEKTLAEPTNNWDKITIWQEGVGSITSTIHLRIILALVFAALTDQSKYPQQTEEDKKLRLKTLWNSFKKLNDNPICHLGHRHEYINALNGVYPGIIIIEDFDALIIDLMKIHAGKILRKYHQENPELYKAVLIAETKFSVSKDPDDKHPIFLKDLFETREEVKQQFKMICRSTGLNHPAIYPQRKIEGYLGSIDTEGNLHIEGWKNLNISVNADTAWQIIDKIYKIKLSKSDSPLLIASLEKTKRWIETSFNFYDQEHCYSLSNFAAVYNAYAQLKKYYHALLSWYPDETKFSDKLNIQYFVAISKIIESYFQKSIERNTPQQLLKQDIDKLIEFNLLCENYKLDNEVEYIKNFFANFLAAIEPGYENEAELAKLFFKIMDPGYKKKYIATDGYLKNTFELSAIQLNEHISINAVDLKPEIINRVFLHALTVKPEEWTEKFYKYFCFVLDKFILPDGFTSEDDKLSSVDVKKGSYPPPLLSQLIYSKEKYLGTHTKPQVNIPEFLFTNFYFPAPHFIDNVNNLIIFLPRLSKPVAEKYLEIYFRECGMGIEIVHIDQLLYLLKVLPDEKKWEFFLNLKHQSLDNILNFRIYHFNEIYQLLKPMMPKDFTFFNFLKVGFNITPEWLANNCSHSLLLIFLSLIDIQDEQIDFINQLEKNGFSWKKIIEEDTNDSIKTKRGRLIAFICDNYIKNVQTRNHIIHRLGKEYLRRLYNSADYLEIILKISGILETDLINVLDKTYFVNLYNSADIFFNFIYSANTETVKKILEVLGDEFALNMFKQSNIHPLGSQLIIWLDMYCPSYFTSLFPLIKSNLTFFVWSIEILEKAIDNLPGDARNDFINSISIDHLYGLLNKNHIFRLIGGTLQEIGNNRNRQDIFHSNSALNPSITAAHCKLLATAFHPCFSAEINPSNILEYRKKTAAALLPTPSLQDQTIAAHVKYQNKKHAHISQLMFIYILLKLDTPIEFKNELAYKMKFINIQFGLNILEKMFALNDNNNAILQGVIKNISTMECKQICSDEFKNEIEKILGLAKHHPIVAAESSNSSNIGNNLYALYGNRSVHVVESENVSTPNNDKPSSIASQILTRFQNIKKEDEEKANSQSGFSNT